MLRRSVHCAGESLCEFEVVHTYYHTYLVVCMCIAKTSVISWSRGLLLVFFSCAVPGSNSSSLTQ
jgi:hypothetical protein